MSEKNSKLTNDDIYSELRNNNEESINFFKGTEIVILNKNISQPVDEDTDIAGLESLLKSFSATDERILFNRLINGEESLDNDLPKKRSVIGKIIDEIIRFIKEIGSWLGGLLSNRISRAETKLRFLEQRRKAHGIKSQPVKYLLSAEMLFIPALGTNTPMWIIDASKVGLNFYKRTITAHKKLMDFIADVPKTQETLKLQKVKVLESIGRIISEGKVSKTGFVTDILPGNKVFNTAIKTTEREGTALYFTEYPEPIKMNAKEWTPTSGLIDIAVGVLNDYISEIKKEQSNTKTLTRQFEQRVKASKNEVNTWSTAYYNWLIELNRRLVSITFQHTMRWFDALENFVASGVN